jgi:hypothetical protein
MDFLDFRRNQASPEKRGAFYTTKKPPDKQKPCSVPAFTKRKELHNP